MYVTLRRVRVTTAVVEKQELLFWVLVYSFSYPECKAHASYFIATRGLSGSTFLHIP